MREKGGKKDDKENDMKKRTPLIRQSLRGNRHWVQEDVDRWAQGRLSRIG